MDRDDSIKKCVICGAPPVLNPFHFNIVCAAHDKYGSYFQLWLGLKELGYAYEMPKMECTFCGVKLSDKEISQIEPSWFNIACETHKEFAVVFQTSMIKAIIEKYPGTTTLEQVNTIRLKNIGR